MNLISVGHTTLSSDSSKVLINATQVEGPQIHPQGQVGWSFCARFSETRAIFLTFSSDHDISLLKNFQFLLRLTVKWLSVISKLLGELGKNTDSWTPSQNCLFTLIDV